MNFTNGETVTRLRAPMVADPYSGASTKRNWEAAVPTEIPGCAVDPGGSVQSHTVNRDSVVTEPTLFAPCGTDVVESDRIVSVTGTWDVEGHGSDWVSPFTGHEFGSVFRLRRSDG